MKENLRSKIDALEKKIDKSVANMFEAIRLMKDQSGSSNPSGSSSETHHQTGSGNHSNYSGVTHLAKIDFPRFKGGKIQEWLFKVEQFFEIDRTHQNLRLF